MGPLGGVAEMKTSSSQLPASNQYLINRKIKLLIFSAFRRVSQGLIPKFIGSNELRVWQSYDRFGNNWWHAYDPVTGRHTSVNSEAELRVWIETRYYN